MDQYVFSRRQEHESGSWTLCLIVSLCLVFLAGCASGDRPPLLIGGQEVVYPATARAEQLEGEVVVGYDVTQTGSVENAMVITSQPPMVFDHAAIETVRSWRFQPARKDGRAVPAPDRRSTLSFKLDSKDPYPEL